jgi:hypothetical protein
VDLASLPKLWNLEASQAKYHLEKGHHQAFIHKEEQTTDNRQQAQTQTAMAGRPSIVGQDAGPEAPYPYQMQGKVISGFGRGSKEVGRQQAHLVTKKSFV